MGRRNSSQGCVATGNQGASGSRQSRPLGLPLNPLECAISKRFALNRRGDAQRLPQCLCATNCDKFSGDGSSPRVSTPVTHPPRFCIVRAMLSHSDDDPLHLSPPGGRGAAVERSPPGHGAGPAPRAPRQRYWPGSAVRPRYPCGD